MKFQKMISMVICSLTIGFAASAHADQIYCTDGLRSIDLGEEGAMTARGFVMTLATTQAKMRCTPDGAVAGFGVWRNWFDSNIYTCRGVNHLVRLYVNRTGLVTSAQVQNAFGVPIFNALCSVKK